MEEFNIQMDQFIDGRPKLFLNRITSVELRSTFSQILSGRDDHERNPSDGYDSQNLEGTTALILYIVGAVIVLICLLFYCKWAHIKWKEQNKKNNARITRPATMISQVETIEIPMQNLENRYDQPPNYSDITGISQDVESESQFHSSSLPLPVDDVTSASISYETVEELDMPPPPYEIVTLSDVAISTFKT